MSDRHTKIFHGNLVQRHVLAAAILVAGYAIAGLAAPASALSLGGLGIRPAYPKPPDPGWFIYQLKPGESVTDAVLVVNGTDQSMTVDLNAVDYEPTDIGAFGVKGSGAEQTDIGKWTQLATTTFTVAPHSEREVEFVLAIPPDADVGEHAGAIMVQLSQAQQSSKISGAYITTRVGARIYNTVPGELVSQLTLRGFSVLENKKTGHYEFTVRAKNEGNVSVSPSLKLHLDGWGLVAVPPDSSPERSDYPDFALFGLQQFLPRVLQTTWQLARDAEVETYFRWRKPYLGRFSATLTMEYERTPGHPEVIQSETLRFTVLPWPETGYALGILAAIFALAITWLVWRKIYFSGRGWRRYTVRAGDTLTLLAAKSSVSWKRISKVNRLKKPYVVSPGDVLLVPAGAKLDKEPGGTKLTDLAAPKTDGSARPTAKRKKKSLWRRWLPMTAIIAAGGVLLALASLLLLRSVLQPPKDAILGTTVLTPPMPKPAAPATSTEPVALPAATTTASTTPPVVVPAKDTVIIEVLNGSGTPGLAGQVVEIFRTAGYRRLTAGNADAFSYDGAVIRFAGDLKGVAEDLQRLLRDRYQKFTLEEVATSTAGVDVTVILGQAKAR